MLRAIILAAVLMVPASARAADPSPGTDPGSCESLRTINATGNKIWVTTYDAGHVRQLDWGWVDPCTVRVWRAGPYSCAAYYHVRAEIKPYDVSKPNVFDTQVQFNPQGSDYSSQVVTLRRSKGTDKYYWEHGNTAHCTPTGVTACCSDWQPPQGSPPGYPPEPRAPNTVDVSFDNATKTYAQVHIYLPGIKAPRTGSVLDGVDDQAPDTLRDECVPPETKKTWNLYGAFEYRVRVTPHLKSCDGEKLRVYVGKFETKGTAAVARFERDQKSRGFLFVDPSKK